MLNDRIELAIAYQRSGRREDAQRLAAELAESLDSDTRTLTWPYYLPWAVGSILADVDQAMPQARGFLKRAADELESYVSIMDPDVRADFLSLPLNRAILASAGKTSSA
jgi:hypothetical protein